MEHVTRTATETGGQIDWWVVDEADDEALQALWRNDPGFGYSLEPGEDSGIWVDVEGQLVLKPELVGFLECHCQYGSFSTTPIPQYDPDDEEAGGEPVATASVAGEVALGIEQASDEDLRRRAYLFIRVTFGEEPSPRQVDVLAGSLRSHREDERS